MEIKNTIEGWKQKYEFYDKITKAEKVARRYFVINAFDGALTIFGVLMGAFVSGVMDERTIVGVSLSTCVAIGVSGLWGAYLSEMAERKRDIKDLEKLMMRKLGGTEIAAASRVAALTTSVINALSPFLTALLILTPFFLVRFGLFHVGSAYTYAFAMSFLIFFALGAFLGRISKEDLFLSGMKMLAAGLFCAMVSWLVAR